MSFGQIILIISCALANLLYLYVGISTSLVQERRTRSVLTVILTVCGLILMVLDADFLVFVLKNGSREIWIIVGAFFSIAVVTFLMIFNLIRCYRLYVSTKNR